MPRSTSSAPREVHRMTHALRIDCRRLSRRPRVRSASRAGTGGTAAGRSAPDDSLDRLCGRELAPERVQVLPQPGMQLRELAALDLLLDVRERFARASPRSVRRGRCPSGRWGSTRRSRPPSASPGGRRARRSAPRGRRAPRSARSRPPGDHYREPSREKLLLELEAEDDVQPVARLVRVDADEPAPGG